MTISSSPKSGEIWLAYIHFLDHPDVGKVRPVLILSNEGTLRVSKITTANLAKSDFPGHVIENWSSCGLLKPSWVQLDPIFRVTQEDLLNDEPLGKMDDDVFLDVVSAINELHANESSY